MIEIYLQLELATARALHTGLPSAPAAELQHTARRLGLALEPLHPGAPDDLMPFFVARGASGDSGRALAALGRCVAVEAAYIKPPSEAP